MVFTVWSPDQPHPHTWVPVKNLNVQILPQTYTSQHWVWGPAICVTKPSRLGRRESCYHYHYHSLSNDAMSKHGDIDNCRAGANKTSERPFKNLQDLYLHSFLHIPAPFAQLLTSLQPQSPSLP